jgi:hypothetical protein
VRPLNHILDLSLRQNAKILIYQSVEIDVLESQIQRLKLHLDDQTLVVGAKIIDQHGSSRGRIPLSGWDSPWNTLALWNPEKLGLIGFPAISGGLTLMSERKLNSPAIYRPVGLLDIFIIHMETIYVI